MSDPVIHILTELQYRDERQGPLKLYIFEEDGYHHGGQWFSKNVRYPDEEIPIERAKVEATVAMLAGREVRVTNSGDFLVFHAKGEEVIWPKEGAEAFWRSIL